MLFRIIGSLLLFCLLWRKISCRLGIQVYCFFIGFGLESLKHFVGFANIHCWLAFWPHHFFILLIVLILATFDNSTLVIMNFCMRISLNLFLLWDLLKIFIVPKFNFMINGHFGARSFFLEQFAYDLRTFWLKIFNFLWLSVFQRKNSFSFVFWILSWLLVLKNRGNNRLDFWRMTFL